MKISFLTPVRALVTRTPTSLYFAYQHSIVELNGNILLDSNRDILGIDLAVNEEYQIRKIKLFSKKAPLIHIRVKSYKIGKNQWKYLLYTIDLNKIDDKFYSIDKII